jgi:hypothetical protein
MACDNVKVLRPIFSNKETALVPKHVCADASRRKRVREKAVNGARKERTELPPLMKESRRA